MCKPAGFLCDHVGLCSTEIFLSLILLLLLLPVRIFYFEKLLYSFVFSSLFISLNTVSLLLLSDFVSSAFG